MTGLVRKAALFAASGLLLASAAMAGVPCPTCSSFPAGMALVGVSATNAPDSVSGKFTVIVRDLANTPINASSVVVDVSGAADLGICDQAGQLNANYTVNCTAKTVRAFTDATGTVNFTILGRSRSGIGTSLPGTVRLFADGVQLTGASFICAAYNLDGAGGVAINDLSQWLADFGGAPTTQRGNYDLAGGTGINDLSVWLGVFGSGRSSAATTYCNAIAP